MDNKATREPVPGIGSLLRACRLRAGVTLVDAAEILNIRRPYLHAIEEERYGDLPGPTYALGFVRGYAEYLGLDSNDVTRRFRAETAGTKGARTKPTAELRFPLAASETASPNGSVLLVGAMIALVAYGGWYALTASDGLMPDLIAPLPGRLASLLPDRPAPQTLPGEQPATNSDVLDSRQPEPAAHASASEGAAEVVPADPVMREAAPHHASDQPVADQPVADAPVADAGTAAGRPRVSLEASEQSWVEIRDRFNNRVFSRLMAPGEIVDVPDQTGLRLTVGNAGGLVIKVDGDAVPPLGGLGVVRRNVPLEPGRLQHAAASAN